ncbi:MAG: PorT family protein [Bacteroidales bacterium]|nr:PorT family protein [Bacteroidales bacterium]
MKKIICSLTLLFVLASALPAAAIGFDWGVTGGWNYSKVKIKNFKTSFDTSNRAGWFIGPKVYLSLPLGFGVDASVQYSLRRMNMGDYVYDADGFAVENADGTNPTVSTTNNYHSFEIPVNLRYSIGLGKVGSVYLATGPQFGFGIGNTKWTNYAGVFKKENMVTTWNLGAGLKVLGHVEVGVGYNFAFGKTGTTTVTKTDNLGNVIGLQDMDFKTNTFQVQLTYIF